MVYYHEPYEIRVDFTIIDTLSLKLQSVNKHMNIFSLGVKQ